MGGGIPPLPWGVRGVVITPPEGGLTVRYNKAIQLALQTPNSLVYCTLHLYPSTSTQCLKNVIYTPMGIHKYLQVSCTRSQRHTVHSHIIQDIKSLSPYNTVHLNPLCIAGIFSSAPILPGGVVRRVGHRPLASLGP